MWPLQIDPLVALGVLVATATTDAAYVMFTASVIARRRGAKLAIVNREPTEMDEIAHLTLHSGIGPTLKAAISAL